MFLSVKRTEFIIGQLQMLGVGRKFGVIDIVPLAATVPLLATKNVQKRRRYRIDDRQSLAQIQEQVESANHLTFNYMCFVVIASLIAAGGLATNSPATVVASMLVSPLMGPIR